MTLNFPLLWGYNHTQAAMSTSCCSLGWTECCCLDQRKTNPQLQWWMWPHWNGHFVDTSPSAHRWMVGGVGVTVGVEVGRSMRCWAWAEAGRGIGAEGALPFSKHIYARPLCLWYWTGCQEEQPTPCICPTDNDWLCVCACVCVCVCMCVCVCVKGPDYSLGFRETALTYEVQAQTDLVTH